MSSVLVLDDHRSYHLYRNETNMRKGFTQICAIITNELGRQATRGDSFIFINKPRTDLKLLIYEQGGFTILYKRLEKVPFKLLTFDLDTKSMQLTSNQLHFILQGVSLKTVRYRKR